MEVKNRFGKIPHIPTTLEKLNKNLSKYLIKCLETQSGVSSTLDLHKNLTESIVGYLQDYFPEDTVLVTPSEEPNIINMFSIITDNILLKEVFFLQEKDGEYTLVQIHLSDQMKGLLNNIRKENEKDKECVQS